MGQERFWLVDHITIDDQQYHGDSSPPFCHGSRENLMEI